MNRAAWLGAVIAAWVGATALADDVGVVANIKVVSDKVKDVSSLEAWRKSYLKDGMSDQEKALAIWETIVAHQHQDSPPLEFLQNEDLVLDPVKIWNVYGYSFCGVAASEVEALGRYAGLKARGWTIYAHVVPELWWDGQWHLLDASLINYFPKPDGQIASVDEIMAAVAGFYQKHPELKGDDKKLQAFHFAEGKKGWKQGPPLLAACPTLNENGWYPARTHGWYSTMQEYDGSCKFEYENGYSLSYQLNVQLRQGERITRNWSNKGLHVNMDLGGGPGCLTGKVGEGAMGYMVKYGDLSPGRVGNGTHQYLVPINQQALTAAALRFENLRVSEGPVLQAADASRPGVLEIRMPSSYLYLSGQLTLAARMQGQTSAIRVQLSDNNGLDWHDVATIAKPGEHTVDLTNLLCRRYDYRLRLTLTGADGPAIQAIRFVHDIQHSQRPLPALDKGSNTITFSASPTEAVITVEGSCTPKNQGKQLVMADFHPQLAGIAPNGLVQGTSGSVTFPITTPGEMTRLRIGSFYQTGGPGQGWDIQVSFDDGKTFKTVLPFDETGRFASRYIEVTDIPPGTTSAKVRYLGTNQGSLGQLLNFHINAHYQPPHGGFRPVRVIYTWDENGQQKRHEHVAQTPQETYTIECAAKPVMKSLVVELAP